MSSGPTLDKPNTLVLESLRERTMDLSKERGAIEDSTNIPTSTSDVREPVRHLLDVGHGVTVVYHELVADATLVTDLDTKNLAKKLLKGVTSISVTSTTPLPVVLV